MTPKFNPTQAVAEYAAGELDSAECARFEERLRAEPAVAAEVRFWRDLRSGLQSHAAAHATASAFTTDAVRANPLPPNLAEMLLRRTALERQTLPDRRLRLPRWVMAASLAAACLALGLGFGAGASWSHVPPPAPPNPHVSEISIIEPVAYGEDGGAVTPPPATVAWTSWMPLSAVDEADSTKPLPMKAVEKPWIGVWTRQARLLLAGNPPREAHLVVRIVGGSPAWKAGLRPGDMIIGIDHCAVDDPRCLGMHLAGAVPGGAVELEFWSAADAAYRSGTAVLETVHE